MTEQPTPTVTSIATPSMEQTHYGIAIANLGTEGGAIALGHHNDAQTLAAFRAFTEMPVDGERITRGWACFRAPQPATGAWEEADWLWVAEPVTAATPGAIAVTYLEA
jgi:hypothetical protein